MSNKMNSHEPNGDRRRPMELPMMKISSMVEEMFDERPTVLIRQQLEILSDDIAKMEQIFKDFDINPRTDPEFLALCEDYDTVVQIFSYLHHEGFYDQDLYTKDWVNWELGLLTNNTDWIPNKALILDALKDKDKDELKCRCFLSTRKFVNDFDNMDKADFIEIAIKSIEEELLDIEDMADDEGIDVWDHPEYRWLNSILDFYVNRK